MISTAAPAAAAPPPISCTIKPAVQPPTYYQSQNTGWCVASDGISISAGAKNLGSDDHYWLGTPWAETRVKLIGFPDSGGIVLLDVGPWKRWLEPGEVMTTPNVIWWVAGTVCAQEETLWPTNTYTSTLRHCVRN